jgi:hypothetical protein
LTEPSRATLFSSYYYYAAMDDEGCLGVCKRSAICTGSEKRVGNGEISAATLRNYIKAVKLFCEMNDIVGLNWKKIRRMLPRL